MDILRIMADAQEAEATVQAAKTEREVGIYHVGGTGIILEDGTCVGNCPRRALARVLGIEQPIEPNRRLMFALGKANEDMCYTDLESAGQTFLREGEIEVEWTTRAGSTVRGHPDGVITEVTSDPMTLEDTTTQVALLEMKAVCSLWTARTVLFDRRPKMDHVIQAAHYMWQTGLPATIWYASRVDWPVATGKANTWMQKFFNSPEFADYVDCNARGEVKKINPFQTFFELYLDDALVSWRSLDDELHTGRTLIEPDTIERYYDIMDDMQATKHLGPRPAKLEADGSRMHWDRCDPAYCPYSALCDRHESDYCKWMDEIKKVGEG